MVLKAADLGLGSPLSAEQLEQVLLDVGDGGTQCWVDWLTVLQPALPAQLPHPWKPCWRARRQLGEGVIAQCYQERCLEAECLGMTTA